MHRSRPLAILILVLLLAACSSTAESSAPATGGDDGGAASDGDSSGGETVSLAGFAFSPSELTIPPGTTVTFTDTANHTVTEGTDGEAVDEPIVDEQGGSDIEVTFDEPGTYNITCKIHPDMNMTITVEG
ncbi:MAG TPA: plastocyanin/azurin family copper-binding protein [Candidatus Limnocylindria bacterium]|nr:plastocyanin/azurin family copper-binding protein [Candidatus Limnocylindria bacterium]